MISFQNFRTCEPEESILLEFNAQTQWSKRLPSETVKNELINV